MQPVAHAHLLADRHHVTLILRLTLDTEQRLVQGELVDTLDTLQQRFVGVTGMHQAVQTWLAQHVHTEGDA